jgi:hypothetical protein
MQIHSWLTGQPIFISRFSDIKDSLKDAVNQGAYLGYAQLSHLNLKDISFEGVDLTGALFDFSNLSDANFHKAKLHKSSFSRSQLDYANLVGADLSSADLRGASFFNADLKGANLKAAMLDYAVFKWTLGIYSFAQVSFSSFGEQGSMLTAFKQEKGDSPLFYCYNYCCSEEELLMEIEKFYPEQLNSYKKAIRAALSLLD